MSDRDDALLVAGVGVVVGLGAAAYMVAEHERKARERRARAYVELFIEVARETSRLRQRDAAAQSRREHSRLMSDFHLADRLCKAATEPLREARRARSVMISEVEIWKRKMRETYQFGSNRTHPRQARDALHEQLASMKARKEEMLADLDTMDRVVARFRCNVDDLVDQREGLREDIRISSPRGNEWYTKWAHLRPADLGQVRTALARSGWFGRLSLRMGRRVFVEASLVSQAVARAWKRRQRGTARDRKSVV